MVYRTADAGYSWINEEKSIAPVSLFGLSFPDTTHGWAAGERGTIIHLQPGR